MTEEEKSRRNNAVQQGSADPGGSEVEQLRRSLAKLKRRLDDQNERIAALARGREEGMATVGDLRAELRLVAEERDRLRRQLTAIEGMQTETMSLDESDIGDETDTNQGQLPSIDELMATFSGHEDNTLRASHSTLRVENDSGQQADDFQEMISPDLLLFGSSHKRSEVRQERYLVLMTLGDHVKCPLDQDLLTIGRSESADIQVDADYISRIHARILRIGVDTVVEDAGSRNGTWVNGERIERRVLQHGDLLRVGGANLRYVDSASADSEAE